jgi:hypothetical protein
MRLRLLPRSLLFGLLGLVTAVAVAWGLSVRGQFGAESSGLIAIGAAVKDGRPFSLALRQRFGVDSEEWRVGALLSLDPPQLARLRPSYVRLYRAIAEVGAVNDDAQVPPIGNADDLAAAGPPVRLRNLAADGTTITRESAGWPLRALRCSLRQDDFHGRADETAIPTSIGEHVSKRGAIEAPWPWRGAAARPPAPGTIYLPIEPRPGLAINAIFYGLLWFLILLIPGTILRARRRARGRCPRCGYSLRGQPAPGCPECGHGREAPAPVPAAA